MEPKIPMYISVQLESGYGKDAKRIWLPLPATKKQFAAAKKSVERHGCEMVIKKYSLKIPRISLTDLMEAPFSQVNHLAARLDVLDNNQIIKLCAVSESEMCFDTVEQLIKYTYNTEKYTLDIDVMSEEDLGWREIEKLGLSKFPEIIMKYIEPHKFGLDIAESENSEFTSFGYLTRDPSWFDVKKKYCIPASLDIKGAFGEELYGEMEIEITSEEEN